MLDTSLRRNVAANLLGRGVISLTSLVAVPIYIQHLGLEAFGLVGFYTALVALSSLFDFGYSTTANRELARRSAVPGDDVAPQDLVFTLQFFYLAGVFFIAFLGILIAPLITDHWLQPESLSKQEVTGALRVMVVVMAIQFPITFYSSCLLGLQRHVVLNVANGIAVVSTVLGTILVLTQIAPTLSAFFIWQGLARTVHAGALAYLTWRRLPAASRAPQIKLSEIRRLWRFAASIAGISVIGLILTQIDNVILSRLLTLNEFGHYTVARTVSQALLILVAPVFTAAFPHFSQLVALGNDPQLRQTYHRVSQLLAVIVMPVALLLVFFGYDVIRVWTGNVQLAHAVSTVVPLLALGTALNGVMNAPYALQLAVGWTRFTLGANLFALVTIVPLTVTLTLSYGMEGAAFAWLCLNLLMLILVLPLMHRRLLSGELTTWYLDDLVLPILPALLLVGIFRLIFTDLNNRPLAAIVLVCILSAATVSAIVAIPWLRQSALQYLRQWRTQA